MILLAMISLAAPPLWWSQGNPPVITGTAENNKGPANIGQAKNMVAQALTALDTAAPTVATQIRADLATSHPGLLTVPSPKPADWADKQKAPLLLGQLKAIAHPFYTQLHAAAPTWLAAERTTNDTNYPNSIFPWTATTDDDANKAIATIGQLKAVFSLRFETLPPEFIDDDYDGMDDNWEIANGLDPQDFYDAYDDPDGDGIENQYEYVLGFDPQNANTEGTADASIDRDGDGMPDAWEAQTGSFVWDDTLGRYVFLRGLDWEVDDASGDPDHDGLSNFAEYQAGTNPMSYDSDYDNLPDGWEIANGLDPLDSYDAYEDTDGDGIKNKYEYALGFDPQNASTGGTPDVSKDRDNDDMPDWWEAATGRFEWNYEQQQYLFVKVLDWEVADGTGDHDQDGLTNSQEFLHGTKPNDYDSDDDYLPDGWEIQNGLVAAISIQVNGSLIYGNSGINGRDGDSDTDGIKNQYEYLLGFNPKSASTGGISDATKDRDGDGMKDWQEAATGTWKWDYNLQRDIFKRGLDWEVNDASGDLDNDGLNNLAEFNAGTNPNDSDTDSDGFYDGLEVQYSFLNPAIWNNPNNDHDLDGMPDLFEAIYGLILNLNDASLDPDDDNLTNFEEFQFGSPPNNPDIDHDGLDDSQERSEATDPWKWDSDGDQLPDGWEVKYALNPTEWQSADLDREPDGLKDIDEVRFGTDPFKDDSDGDGVGDGDEVANNTDPMDDEWGGIPPAAPSNVVETQNTDGTTSFTWQDNSNNEKSFRIYRHLPDGNKQLLGEVQADTTSFIYTPPSNP